MQAARLPPQRLFRVRERRGVLRSFASPRSRCQSRFGLIRATSRHTVKRDGIAAPARRPDHCRDRPAIRFGDCWLTSLPQSLCQASVDKTARRIVKQVREVVIRPRWIVIENVVDAERDCRLIEQISPRRPAINQALFWLGMGLYLIRRLHIEEPCLPDPMLIDPVRAK